MSSFSAREQHCLALSIEDNACFKCGGRIHLHELIESVLCYILTEISTKIKNKKFASFWNFKKNEPTFEFFAPDLVFR